VSEKTLKSMAKQKQLPTAAPRTRNPNRNPKNPNRDAASLADVAGVAVRPK